MQKYEPFGFYENWGKKSHHFSGSAIGKLEKRQEITPYQSGIGPPLFALVFFCWYNITSICDRARKSTRKCLF